ncbi:heparinase II/III domain-containing protein [Haloferula sp.]|uniref:heparinase II/III domain-containing protein n=1 Tax=Haloferula sp. TaxID=2497595 RepID=UPI003C71F102
MKGLTPDPLAHYAPDGLYPEGPGYWAYGSGFTIVTIAMLESALESDFGISASPGFMESAVFRSLTTAPSGMYYNFADCREYGGEGGDVLLAWFAAKSGNRTFFEKERFMLSPERVGRLSGLDGAAMAWLSQFEEKTNSRIPSAWKGDGSNPIVIFTGGEDDPHQYYFGGKGGKAAISHGNMDAGSFVFEMDGIRWVIDPGMQGYHELEKTGFKLWGRKQDSERWTLLTKNNFGHSGLTLNNEFHRVDGFAPLIDFKEGEVPEATFDLTEVYGENAAQVTRRFIKDGPASLLVHDIVELTESTERITWQVMTTAEVELSSGGALLRQGGKVLRVESLSHPEVEIAVVPLDPPH